MIVLEPYGSHLNKKYNFSFWALFGLVFSHLVTAWIWYQDQVWNLFKVDNYYAYCTPLFKSCAKFSFSDVSLIQFLVLSYFLLSAACLVIHLISKSKISNYLFYALLVMKFIFMLLRMDFVNSYNEIHLALCLVYALSAGAQLPYRFVLCVTYFVVGISKLNHYWITGEEIYVLYQQVTSSVFLTALYSYFAILQTVLIWGLLFGTRFIKQLTILQLVLLHGFLFFYVDLEYTLLFAGIISPLFISDFIIKEEKVFKDFTETNILRQVGFALFLIYLFIGENYLRHNKLNFIDSGKYKLLDINIKEIESDCRHQLIEVKNDKTIVLRQAPDIDCKKVAYESFLTRLCETEPDKKFLFYVEKKEKSEKVFKQLERYSDVCKNL